MIKASFKLQNYILPIGFAAIICLMISAAFLTTDRIERKHQTITKIQLETNKTNELLVKLADAEYQRIILLFHIFQSNESFIVDDLAIDLNFRTVESAASRKEFAQYDLTQNQNDFFTLQSKMSDQNIITINHLIDLLHDNKDEEAKLILKDKLLPKMRQLLRVIASLHKETNLVAKEKLLEIDKISKNVSENIFRINMLVITSSFLLMLFLIRKQQQSDSSLSLLASTDKLTDLPNRDNFIQHIDQLILKEPDTQFSIVFLDIDYFKSINDNYGHEVGDIVLKLFSKTIRKFISDQDVLSRFGGDEFVLLLKHEDNFPNLKRLIINISNGLDTSFHIGTDEVFISASIGVCTYPYDGNNAKTLLKNADIAMYSAKQNGRNCYQLYSLDDSNKIDREHALSHALQTILKNKNSDNQLSLVYQPLVNINDKHFNECEALIRWKDTDGNLINTVDFIETAEKSNLIEKVNTFVIEEVCKQQARWQKEGIDDIRIHINLSGNKRIFSNLFGSLAQNVAKHNLSPKLFGIELTERTMYEISEETYDKLDHFRNIGMKISIDDFGTGYSSLSYLKKLPITSVKIDREFITGLPNNKVDIALVKAIITLAHSLDFDVVAEGVETQEQFDFLDSCECNIAQGYLLHKPMSPEKISELKLVA